VAAASKPVHLSVVVVYKGGDEVAAASRVETELPPSRCCVRGRWRGAAASNDAEKTPPARSCTRGRWLHAVACLKATRT
jgi:hypothetical protein